MSALFPRGRINSFFLLKWEKNPNLPLDHNLGHERDTEGDLLLMRRMAVDIVVLMLMELISTIDPCVVQESIRSNSIRGLVRSLI